MLEPSSRRGDSHRSPDWAAFLGFGVLTCENSPKSCTQGAQLCWTLFKSLLHIGSGAAAAIPAFTDETAEASEGRRAGKEAAGHISPQGSAPWSPLSRHLPPCTADEGFRTDLAAWGTQAPGTAWPGHSEWIQLRPDLNLAANGNMVMPTSNFRCACAVRGPPGEHTHTNCVCTAERLLVAPGPWTSHPPQVPPWRGSQRR